MVDFILSEFFVIAIFLMCYPVVCLSLPFLQAGLIVKLFSSLHADQPCAGEMVWHRLSIAGSEGSGSLGP